MRSLIFVSLFSFVTPIFASPTPQIINLTSVTTNDLDKVERLNRKSVTAKLMASHPAAIRAYDLLSVDGEDLRDLVGAGSSSDSGQAECQG